MQEELPDRSVTTGNRRQQSIKRHAHKNSREKKKKSKVVWVHHSVGTKLPQSLNQSFTTLLKWVFLMTTNKSLKDVQCSL